MSRDGTDGEAEMSDDVFERADEVLSLFRRGAEFTRELLEENNRLRAQLVNVETRQEDAALDTNEWGKLRSELLQKIAGLETERKDTLERLEALEDENRQFASRYLEIEEENNALAT